MRKYTIVIDEDVPLAKKNSARGEKGSRYQHPLSHLLRQLRVKESFVYPVAVSEEFGRLRSVAHYNSQSLGRKFTSRMVKDHEQVTRLRFWRTA